MRYLHPWPLGTRCSDPILQGNSTYAGGFAAVVANVVLIGYIIVAMNEDQSDQLEKKKEVNSKKEL